MEQFFIIKQNVKLNCEHSPNAESGSDKKGAHKLIARTNRPFEKGIRQKKHNITFNKNKEAIFNSSAKRFLKHKR